MLVFLTQRLGVPPHAPAPAAPPDTTADAAPASAAAAAAALTPRMTTCNRSLRSEVIKVIDDVLIARGGTDVDVASELAMNVEIAAVLAATS